MKRLLLPILVLWLCACNGALDAGAPALSELDPCDLCGEGTTCLDGACVPDTLVCGGDLCEVPGVCIEGACRPALTVATFNLYDLELPNSPANLARYIADRAIDLILFQEIQPLDASDIVQSLAAEGVEMHYAFSSRGGYGGEAGNDYLAVFSRFPLTSHETILGGTYRDPVTGESFSFANMRPVHRIRLTVHGQDLVVYNLHLKAQVPFPDCEDCLALRRTQAFALESYILENDDPEEDLILIGGDANSAIPEDFEPGNTLDRLTLRSDNPAGVANDFTAVNDQYRHESTHLDFDSLLDHLILSPALMSHYVFDSVEVVAPAGGPSDHKSVLLRLAF